MDFILKCEKHKISIFRIEVVRKVGSKTISSLDKVLDCDDQIDVYAGFRDFVLTQMNDEWNYATFVTD